MRTFRMIGIVLLAVLMCVNFASCSSDDDSTENPGKNEYGLPTNIAKNTIIYKTSDNIIIRFENEDVFGGARIVSNTYSTTNGYGTITFSSEVTAIEEYAFNGENVGWSNEDKLIAIVLPASVASIGRGAFNNSSGLTSVTIPNSVTNIGDYAFRDCSSLTSVTIPNSVTSIGYAAFYYCESLTSITIPNSVTSIGGKAFSSCDELKDVHISDLSVWCGIDFESASSNPLCNGGGLYLNGKKVTDLVIPNGIEKIKDYAFYYCESLTSVTIPNSVTSIGYAAFEECDGLTSVTIPNSVTSIGSYAFHGCDNLTSVYVKATTPPYIYHSTFSSSTETNATLYVPNGILENYKNASYWGDFENIQEF